VFGRKSVAGTDGARFSPMSVIVRTPVATRAARRGVLAGSCAGQDLTSRAA
jgi:hypothetical protein